MNISAWAIKRPVPVILLFLILTLMGLMAFRSLGINDNPDVDFPIVVVSVGQPGASPAEMETEITRKVEDALVGIAHLEHLRSTISDGGSTTVAEFAVGANVAEALNDVRDAVSRIRQTLPADITEPQITHPDFSGEPFITYTVGSAHLDVAELSRTVDEDITRALLNVPGVAQVRRSGGLNREIQVRLEPSRLHALGLTVDQVNNQLRALNLNLPGGRSEAGGQEQTIRTLGMAKDVEALRAFEIALPSGQRARLDTIGTVSDTHAEVRQLARLNGKPVVAFSVVRAQGAPLVQTEEAVRAEVTALAERLPNVKFELIRTMADYTRMSYHASLDALVLGSVLAVIVIFVFLRSWQSTLISALAIPLSVISTFLVMKWIGYTLNDLTLLGLTLVVGILVDDAIVDLENIDRHIRMGKPPFQAAIEATEEIGLAVVATTLTIVAVFVPVAFMGGIPGMFFRSFGITVAIAVLFSLLVARTLTPMMAAYMLPRISTHVERKPFYMDLYLALLSRSMRHRWITMASAVGVFVASLALVPLLPKGFLTAGDIGQSLVSIELPTGATLEDTRQVVAATSRLFEDRPEVKHVFATVGSAVSNGFGGGDGGPVNKGTVNVILVPKHDRTLSLKAFEDALRPRLSAIPGARVIFNQYGATGSAKPINIILQGSDAVALASAGEQALSEMRRLPELRDVTSSAAEQRPELLITPNLARAAEQGVSVATIGRLARLGTQGDSDFNLPKLNVGDRQLNIRVLLNAEVKRDVSAIGNLLVPGRAGLVPLSSVADIRLGSGPVQIDRYDRQRQVTLTANLTAGNMGAALEKIQALPAIKNLPPGVKQDTVGESKVMIDIFTSFMLALGTAVLFIYAVLVLLFGGFLQPLTIMMALPLSFGGALFGLLLGQKELGMMSLIGIVMLMGLVCKNSILLVEYAMMAQRSGMTRHEALMRAGSDRLRPILMTTIAMIAGMLPIALSLGEGTEGLSPMAVAVIGGLITSTLFTLVVIPAVYTVVDDFQSLLGRLVRRKGDPSDPAPPSEAPSELRTTV